MFYKTQKKLQRDECSFAWQTFWILYIQHRSTSSNICEQRLKQKEVLRHWHGNKWMFYKTLHYRLARYLELMCFKLSQLSNYVCFCYGISVHENNYDTSRKQKRFHTIWSRNTLQILAVNLVELAKSEDFDISCIKVCSLLEWSFIISIDTSWDWFQRTYVLITARKNL